jgi:hypothetical protein
MKIVKALMTAIALIVSDPATAMIVLPTGVTEQ